MSDRGKTTVGTCV